MKINELPEIEEIKPDDYLLIYDTTNNITGKIKASNLNFGSNAPTPSKLNGTPFGLSPFWENNPIFGFDKVFDGSTNTFYCYANPDGGYVGLDFGVSRTITKIRYYPRSDYSGGSTRAIGGRFQIAATNNNSSYTDFATITTASNNTWDEITLNSPVNGRFFRYLSPNGGYGNIAEIEVYGY